MKIAMYNLTTTCRYGGIETFVWEISRELARRGEEVHILGGRGNISKNMPGVKVWRFPFWPRNRVPNLGTRFRKLAERLSMGIFALSSLLQEEYAIFHIHKPFDLPLGFIIKKIKKSRLILGSHGRDFFWGDRFFASRIDAAVSCSHFNGREVENRYGIKTEVIYNGIDPQVFLPLPPDREIPQKLGLRVEKNKTLMYAGRLIGWKGISELLKAVAHLKDSFPIQTVIIGEGEARPSLQKLAVQLGIQDQVTFTGFVPNQELPKYYSVADLAVFPSLADETFGISICEAMACGLPVVSTMVGGIPEVIQDGVTGLLANPKNSRDLAIKVSSLLNDGQLRQKMGEAGRKRVLDNFTWEKVADRLQQVYREALLRKIQ